MEEKVKNDFALKRVWGPEPKYPTVLSIPKQERDMIVIAGPCSIESPEQIETICKEMSRVNLTFMRGGVFRAGTYPPESFGINWPKLEMWHRIAKQYGLKIISEVLSARHIDKMAFYVDAFQIGARHMQDYALLDLLSRCEKPVTLKRNMGATLDEFLGAAEYLVRYGKRDVILIERGSSTYMNHVRWDLSISTIAAINRMTGLPILVDASHGTGRRDLVEPMTLAGMAAGADGFLVEVHPDPDKSLTDFEQAYPLQLFEELYARAGSMYENYYKSQRLI